MVRIHIARRLSDVPSLTEWENHRQRMPHWRVCESLYWMEIAHQTLGHRPYYITAWKGDSFQGVLPVAGIRSLLFGHFLISMPYVNWGGVQALSCDIENVLLEAAIQLAEQRNVDFLELRGHIQADQAHWVKRLGHKVIMLLELPGREEKLWHQLSSKVRNQVKKAQKANMRIQFAGGELIKDFYRVYIRNMRYLGTPSYPLEFVEAITQHFAKYCEICVVRNGRNAVAGAVLLHGNGITEVPLAACLPEYRSSCANMLLYWELLCRSIRRGSTIFDFGRCTPNSGSYYFKKQWNARPKELVWYYYIRSGEPCSLVKEHPRFALWQNLWKHLPLPLAQWIGPYIVRGLPV